MYQASVLILEDEPLIADDLAGILVQHGFVILGIADEGKELLEMASQLHPDVVLLDINVHGSMDGIMVAAKLKVPFIFLTSYYDQKTLIRAGAVNPSGYIVKPWNEADLIANIELALRRKTPQLSPGSSEKLFVKKGNEIVSIMSNQIAYVEALDNYAYLFTQNDKYIISHTLKSVEEKLLPLGFLRVHRSFLINFSMIDAISENFVFLKGHKVMIGKSYRKEFMDRLQLL